MSRSPNPKPRSRLTPQVRRDVFVDNAAFRLVASRAERPDEAEVARIADEVTKARDLFEREGWVDDPASYHQVPPAVNEERLTERRSGTIRYTGLTWLDGYAPRPEEPGAVRFVEYPKNMVARAMLMVHRSSSPPWLVIVHGFGMGTPGLDLRAFRALHLHRTLGLNLAFLTLPFHGPRNPASITKPIMPSADVMDTVHGLTQAVWDTRQLIEYVRARTDQPIGLLGLSLGGLVSAVTASVDEPHAVILEVPAVDMPTLMRDATSGVEDGALADKLVEQASPIYGPVSPLRLEPRVPLERRHIIAGTLDRFARPSTQAVELWHHWGEPHLHWYHGGHTSVFWSGAARTSLDEALRESGLVAAGS